MKLEPDDNDPQATLTPHYVAETAIGEADYYFDSQQQAFVAIVGGDSAALPTLQDVEHWIVSKIEEAEEKRRPAADGTII